MATAAVRRVGEKLSRFCGAATTYGPCIGACNPDFVRRPYETDDTVFVYIVRVEYPSLFEMAFERGATLVVPAGISLPAQLTLEDVENHIIYETRVPGEYRTLNGKTLFIDGNELCTAQGFEEERRVRILVNEEVQDQDHPDRKLKVLQVSRPVEGGVQAPDEQQDEMDLAAIRKYSAVLRCHPEVEGVFKDMDAFVDEVNFLGQHAPEQFKRLSLEELVLVQWQASVEALQQSGLFTDLYYLGGGRGGATPGRRGAGGEGPGVLRERHRLQLAQMVESYLLGGIHASLYPWLQRQHGTKDQLLAQVLDGMRFYTPSDVGLAPEFHCCVEEAAARLGRLASCTTPLEKLLCLKGVAVSLFRSVQQHLRVHFPGEQLGDLQLATDDLVQLIAYTIIRGYPGSSWLQLDLGFIRAFHLVSTSTSATGYYYNSFEVAVDFLLSKGVASRDQQEGEQQGGHGGASEAKGGEEEAGEEEGEGAVGGDQVVAVPPPQTDVALLENVTTVLQERGQLSEAAALLEAAAQLGLPLPPTTAAPPPAPTSGKRGGKPSRKDDDEDDDDDDDEGVEQEEEGKAGGGVATSGSSPRAQQQPGQAASSKAQQSMVMVFGDGGVRLRGDQAMTQLISVDEDEEQAAEGGRGGGSGRVVTVTQARAGQQFFAVLTSTGEVQTWGLAEGGRLGHQDAAHHLDAFFPTQRPQTVRALPRDLPVTQVVCGGQHVLVVTANGELYAWGDNRCGQLGLGRTSSGGGSGSSCSAVPGRVDFLAGQVVTGVAAGHLHSLALTDQGQVYSWGRAQSGRLGRLQSPACQRDEFSPGLIHHDWSYREVVGPEFSGSGPATTTTEGEEQQPAARVVSLAAGWSHSIAVLSDGRVMTWGAGAEGRLGHGCYCDEFSPRQVRALSSPHLHIVQASAGYGHSVFLTDHGEVFVCGYNKFGQLGVGGADGRPATLYPEVGVSSASKTKVPAELLPRRVKGALRGVNVTSISAGENHTACRSADGRIFTWGLNLGNQCGHGRAIDQQNKPKEVAVLRGAKQVSCGASHTIVVM